MNTSLVRLMTVEQSSDSTQLCKIIKMRQWLKDNKISFYEIRYDFEFLPYVFHMDSRDAIAFKLKFGL